MDEFRKMYICGLLFVIICLFTGCGEYHANYTFEENGGVFVTQNAKFAEAMLTIDPDIKKEMNSLKKSVTKGYDVQDKENEFLGSKRYKNIQELVNTNEEIWNPNENYKGVQVKSGFLFDDYSLDLIIAKDKGQNNFDYNNQVSNSGYFSINNKTNSGLAYYEQQKKVQRDTQNVNKVMNAAIQLAVESARTDFTLHLPYPVEGTNADVKNDGGKSLSWDMKPALLGEKDVQVKAKFKIYHKNALIMLAVIGVMLFVSAIVLFVLLMVKQENNKSRKYMKKAFFVCLLILLSGGGCIKHVIATPSVFTSADRVISSEAKDSEGRPLADTLKKEVYTKENPLNDIKSILQKKEIRGEVLAASAKDEEGFLALLRKDGNMFFIAYSAKDDQVAKILYPNDKDRENPNKDILNFRASPSKFKNGTISYRPLIFTMEIAEDTKNNKDQKLGIWNGTVHLFSVYAFFEVDDVDKVIPGRLTSADKTLYPSHYQTALQEMLHVNLSNVVLTHLDGLKIDIRKRDVDCLKNDNKK